MNLYFTYESRDTLKSFTLFITVKAISKLNLGHRDKFEIEYYKIALFTVSFSHLHYNGIQRGYEAISG